MADVQANIEVNAKMNTSSVDEGINRIKTEFNDLSGAVDKSLNEPAKVTTESYKELTRQFEELSKLTLSMDGLIPDEQLTGAVHLLNELGSKINDVGHNLDVMRSSESLTSEYIIDGLREVGSAFQSGIEEPTKYSKEQLDELLTSFNNLIDLTSTLKLDVFDDGSYAYIKEQIAQISGLYDSIVLMTREYNSEVETSNEETKELARTIDKTVGEFGGMLNQLRSSFALTEQETEALQKEEAIRQALVEKINEMYAAQAGQVDTLTTEEQLQRDLVAAAQDYNSELIDTGEYIKSPTEQLEEQKRQAEELKELFSDMHYPGEELENDSPKVENFSKLVEVLASKLGISNSEAAGLAKSLGATAGEAAAAGVAIGVIVGVLKIYVDRLHEAEDALKKLGEGLLNAGVNGVQFFIDAIGTLVDSLDEALGKMEEFAEKGAEIQTAYYNTFTVLGSKAGNEILDFADKLEQLYGLDGDALVEDMQAVVAAAGSLGVNTDDMVRATENMTVMANNLSMLAGSFQKASNDIGNAISKGFVGRNSVLYVLMTKQEKDALKELNSEVERYNYLMSLSGRIKDRYIAFLSTEAGKVMLLNNQYSILMNNISKLALGLYAKIAPLLTELIKLANRALTWIMKVFNIDVKSSADTGTGSIAEGITNTMKSAGDSSKKAAKDIKKSTKESKKAIKELEAQVASFDDVIQIKDNKANDDLIDLGDLDTDLDGIGDLDDGLQDLIGDFNLLDDAVDTTNHEFDEFWDRIDKGQYFEAGEWLADYLIEKMRAIPWDEIQEKAAKFGNGIAKLLNGLISKKDLWYEFGRMIAEALDTAVTFLFEFAKEFDFEGLGDSLFIAWQSFWDNFDKEKAGQALYEWFIGVFKLLNGFFTGNPLTKFASGIVKIMHSFFESLAADDDAKSTMAETVVNIIDDVFNAALTLLTGISGHADEIIGVITNILDSIIDWLDKGGGDKILGDIGDAIVGIINKLKDSGIVEKIRTIIDKALNDIKFDEILASATDLAMDVWVNYMQVKTHYVWTIIKTMIKSLFVDGIKDLGKDFEDLGEAIGMWMQYVVAPAIDSALYEIKESFTILWETIKTNVAMALDTLWDTIYVNVKEALDTLWDTIYVNVKESFTILWETIQSLANIGFAKMKAKLEEIWTSIKNFFNPDKWKGIARDAMNGFLNGLKEIWNRIREWWNGTVGGKSIIDLAIPNWVPLIGGKTWDFKIPRLATGGIVTQSTLANIGEAGREAVLPLDRNTGWMDMLADKLASKQNSGNNTPVIIDMSKINKPYYSRAEMLEFGNLCFEAMEARGVAVSRAY